MVMEHVYSLKQERIQNVDTLIYANHSLSDNSLYQSLKKSGRKVYDIGDCRAPRLIEQVIYESEVLAREIE